MLNLVSNYAKLVNDVKNRGLPKSASLFVFMDGLALSDSLDGAGAGAGTAVNAGTGIDHHVIVTHRDSTNGAAALASAAADASVSDDVSHEVHLRYCILKQAYSSTVLKKCKYKIQETGKICGINKK